MGSNEESFCTVQTTEKTPDDEVFKLAPFNPSSDQVQEKALDLLQLTDGDVFFDLGCGDGRLLCSAAVRCPGLKCVGVEIDSVFVDRARQRVNELPPEASSRVDIRLEDVLQQLSTGVPSEALVLHDHAVERHNMSDLTLMVDATALYLFVLPKGIVKLMPILNAVVEKRRKDARRFQILSYMFKIHGWEPSFVDTTPKGGFPLYYYEFGATTL